MDKDATIAGSGYVADFLDTRHHHEIHLGDPRKTAPEKLKTVIRYPIARNSELVSVRSENSMGNIEKFDAMASNYDTAERCKVAEVIAEQIRRNVHNATDKCALDYGCGTGLVGLRLLDVFKHIIFIDAAPNMAQMVKQKIDAGHIINADVLPCDLSVDNPPNLKSDYIILAQVLLHIKDIAHLLRRLHSVLNDGGHLLIIDFDKNSEIDSEYVHNGFEQEKLAAQARMAGFVKIKSSTFYHGNKMFMNKDASLFMLDAVKSRKFYVKVI